jgi:hypothetical protein
MACGNKNCGCQDTGLTTQIPCDNFLCPTPNPCSETFDACCIIYTGPPVGSVQTGDKLCDIIQKLAIGGSSGPNSCRDTEKCYSIVTNFVGTPTSSTSITLSWTANPLAGQYGVYYKPATGSTYSLFATITNPLTASIVVTGLTAGTAYDFVIITACP